MYIIMLFLLSFNRISQKSAVLFQDDFEGTSLQWTISGGEWEWGAPQGLGGANYGNPDPSSAHSGTKVIGTDLSGDGDYSANANCSITSYAIDCSGYIGVTLGFYRWLNVERSTYDQAKVEVSNDGSNWTTVWQNPDNQITDNGWSYQEFDISSVADNQSTVYVRFTLTSDGSWQYSGWNIDDVVITGNNNPDITVESYSPTSADPGDSNVPFTVLLKNQGTDASNVRATLASDDAYISVSSTNNPFNAGSIVYGATATNTSNPYYINVSSSCPDGHEARLLLDITADGGYSSEDTLMIKIGRVEWTFMVYINGDNNLSSYGDDDRAEMEQIGSSNDVNIVVQQDWSTSYGGNDGTVRWFVNHGSSDTVMALPEQDMGVPSTLIDFANWAIDNYPAKHYALIIWDHGSGWDKSLQNPITKGFSWDDQSGSHFSVAGGDMDTALYYIKQHLGHNLDILGFDACLMATLEVGEIARKYVDFIDFSEKTEPGDGWPYNDVLDTLVTNPYITPYEFAGEIARRYVASYSGGSQGTSDATQSAIDLGEDWHKLLMHLDHLSKALIDAGGKGDGSIWHPRNNTIEMDDGTHTLVDLYDAVDQIKANNINATINALCDSVEAYINKVVIYHGYSGSSWASTHGLSIYYPDRNTSVDASYANFDFAQTNTWYDFISGASSQSAIRSVVMHVSSYIFDDLYNHNGSIGQGEEVALYPTIENSGNTTASGVQVVLRSDDPDVTVLDSLLSIGDISPFSEVASLDSVRFLVSNNTPLDSKIVVKFVMTSANKATTNTDYLSFEVSEPLKIAENHNNKSELSAIPAITRGYMIYGILPSDGKVTLSLFNVEGRLVKNLYKGYIHSVMNIPVHISKSGLYFLVEQRGNGIKRSKILVVK